MTHSTAAADLRVAQLAQLSGVRSVTPARIKNLLASASAADSLELTDLEDEELVRRAREGEEAATIALFIRYLAQTEGRSIKYGVLDHSSGPGAVFDEDDMFQEQALAMLEAIRDEDDPRSLKARYDSAARSAGYNAYRFAVPYTNNDAPGLRRVKRYLTQHNGDLHAAFGAMNAAATEGHKLSWERFMAQVNILSPGNAVELNATVGRDDEDTISVADVTADPAAEDAFRYVEGTEFRSDDVQTAWDSLDKDAQDLLAARLGLFTGEKLSTVALAEVTGIPQSTVSYRCSQSLKKIASQLKSRRTTQQVTKDRSVKSDKAAKPEPVEFPVHVRKVGDEVPEGPKVVSRVKIRTSPVVEPNIETGVLAGNVAWGGKHRDYDAPQQIREVTYVPTTSTELDPDWDAKTEARLAAIRARQAAAKKAEAEDFRRFVRTLRQY